MYSFIYFHSQSQSREAMRNVFAHCLVYILYIQHQTCSDWLRRALSVWTDTFLVIGNFPVCDNQSPAIHNNSSGKILRSLRVIRGCVYGCFSLWLAAFDSQILVMSSITWAVSLTDCVSWMRSCAAA